MFRSSLAILVGGTAASAGPALSEVIPQPELRAAAVGLLTSLCIAGGDAILRAHRERQEKRSRVNRRRKTRAIPPAQQKQK